MANSARFLQNVGVIYLTIHSKAHNRAACRVNEVKNVFIAILGEKI